jgi:putative tryptophan/tyrosine transport system substrate-binding protein
MKRAATPAILAAVMLLAVAVIAKAQQPKKIARIVPPLNPVTFGNRDRIASFVEKNKLPSIYAQREYVDAGGLISYGPSTPDMHRRAATYVDKILKGTKPADLPVEQPRKFELVINLKAAKQIGLAMPPNVLARADKVMK